jgi:hypothetical protein
MIKRRAVMDSDDAYDILTIPKHDRTEAIAILDIAAHALDSVHVA